MVRGAASFAAAAVILLAGGASTSTFQAIDAGTALAPGHSVERSLDGAERHVYAVTLNAGECADVTVDQDGVDVVVRVLDAAGAPVAVFDQESRTHGREHVAFVADASRVYRFTIAARYTRHDAGGYSVKLDAIRPATDRDRSLFRAHVLSAESDVLRAKGQMSEARARAADALAIAEGSLGSSDGYVAALGMTLGVLQGQSGLERESEQTFLHAIAVSDASVGREDPQTAHLMDDLGILYDNMNEYDKSESQLEEALSITERTLGEHPRLAGVLVDLSVLHERRGDYTRARTELQRALAIADRTMTSDDVIAIAIVNDLANLELNLGHLDRAKPLFERALESWERVGGAESMRLAYPLAGLSIIAREQGDYPTALQYLQRAYDIRKKVLGENNPDTAELLITFGNVYRVEGRFQEAIETYQRAYAVLEPAEGPYGDDTLLAMADMALTYAAEGKVEQAVEEQSRYDALAEKAIAFNLAIGSEHEKLAYEKTTFEMMGRTISLNLQEAPRSRAAADLAAAAILRRKGRVLDALADSREALRRRLDPDDRKLLDEVSSVTANLAKLALAGPGKTPRGEYRTHLANLEAERESLEARISRRSAQFRADIEDPSLAAVRAALPPDSAIVEYVVYEPFDPTASTDKDAHGAARYAAYVIRRDSQTRGVDLGPARTIDAEVRRVREALRDPSRADAIARARALDERVVKPVRALAGDAARLLVAPDGALNLVPFEALVDGRGQFEVQRYAISYLSSGRDVVRMDVARASAGPPVIMADPAFGEPTQATSSAEVRAASTVATRSTVYFPPLDGTAQEASAIEHLLPDAVMLTGARATKSALMHVNAPSILHIASHAFFLGDTPASAGDTTRSMTTQVDSSNPLLRSGIALAGANLSSRGDAGIVTALEASTLNLWGTKLVTLSACDTGVGDVTDGEGVYGLRRAFLVAGAESVVMSLWPVSDSVTRTIMTRYYAGLARGEGREAALRRVQLGMLRDKRWHHPFYWAGFIEAGDWSPIPRS